jgi:hypothetical protein
MPMPRTLISLVPLMLALAAITPSCAIGNSLTGVVLKENFSPAEGATVTLWIALRSTPLETVSTDKNGAFSFSKVGPGEYRVQVVADGYTPAQVMGIRIAADEDLRLRRILLERYGPLFGDCSLRLQLVGQIALLGWANSGDRIHVDRIKLIDYVPTDVCY